MSADAGRVGVADIEVDYIDVLRAITTVSRILVEEADRMIELEGRYTTLSTATTASARVGYLVAESFSIQNIDGSELNQKQPLQDGAPPVRSG